MLTWARFGEGETATDALHEEHVFAWALDGEDCLSVLYLRWDAYGDGEDTWIREDVVVRVTVLYDNK